MSKLTKKMITAGVVFAAAIILMVFPKRLLANDEIQENEENICMFEDDISAYSMYITKSFLDFSKPSIECKCSINITCSTSINTIKVSYQLQKTLAGKWTTVDAWSNTIKSNKLSSDKYITLTSGKYRVVATINVYNGTSLKQTLTKTSNELDL